MNADSRLHRSGYNTCRRFSRSHPIHNSYAAMKSNGCPGRSPRRAKPSPDHHTVHPDRRSSPPPPDLLHAARPPGRSSPSPGPAFHRPNESVHHLPDPRAKLPNPTTVSLVGQPPSPKQIDCSARLKKASPSDRVEVHFVACLPTPEALCQIERHGSARPFKLISQRPMPARNERSSKYCELDGETIAVEAFKPAGAVGRSRQPVGCRLCALIHHRFLLSRAAVTAASHDLEAAVMAATKAVGTRALHPA